MGSGSGSSRAASAARRAARGTPAPRRAREPSACAIAALALLAGDRPTVTARYRRVPVAAVSGQQLDPRPQPVLGGELGVHRSDQDVAVHARDGAASPRTRPAASTVTSTASAVAARYVLTPPRRSARPGSAGRRGRRRRGATAAARHGAARPAVRGPGRHRPGLPRGGGHPTTHWPSPSTVSGSRSSMSSASAGSGQPEPPAQEGPDRVLEVAHQLVQVDVVDQSPGPGGAARRGSGPGTVRAPAAGDRGAVGDRVVAERTGLPERAAGEVALVDGLERVVDDHLVPHRRAAAGGAPRGRARRAAPRPGRRAAAAAPVRSSAPEYRTTRCSVAAVIASRNSWRSSPRRSRSPMSGSRSSTSSPSVPDPRGKAPSSMPSSTTTRCGTARIGSIEHIVSAPVRKPARVGRPRRRRARSARTSGQAELGVAAGGRGGPACLVQHGAGLDLLPRVRRAWCRPAGRAPGRGCRATHRRAGRRRGRRARR